MLRKNAYLVTKHGKGSKRELFSTVWVGGTLSVKHISSDLAEAEYALYARSVEAYK